MSLVVKGLLLGLCLSAGACAQAATLRILILGEAMAGNCHEVAYPAVPGVYRTGPGGHEIAAQDPLAGGDCAGGSMWMPLGKLIVGSGLADRVVFVPVAVPEASVNDWRPGGRAAQALRATLTQTKRQGAVFDWAFWVQGPSDARLNYLRYASGMRAMFLNVGAQASIKRWLIARHTTCGGQPDERIGKVQTVQGSIYLAGRFQGPDLDHLAPTLRLSGCRLNRAGQAQAAQMWLQAMVRAEQLSKQATSEALVKVFQ
jgi:hypothetical protein